MSGQIEPGRWKLRRNQQGQLLLGEQALPEIAKRYETPLYVLDLDTVTERAHSFRAAFQSRYPGEVVPVHPLRSNDVSSLTGVLAEAGFAVEVTTELELELALRAGVAPRRVLLNGVHKPTALLERALRLDLLGVVADSLGELQVLQAHSERARRQAPLPIFVRARGADPPGTADAGAVTGTKAGGPRGVDASSGELEAALELVGQTPSLRYLGPYLGLGADLRDPRPSRRMLNDLPRILTLSRRMRLETTHLFLGGGFGTSTSREMSTRELLLYQGAFVLPPVPADPEPFPALAAALVDLVLSLVDARASGCPRLIVETGRYVTGPAQVLLVTASHVKRRKGVAPWIVTDGGAGTVAFPLYYEIHEVLNCSRAESGPRVPVTMVGPVCYSTDWIYRNKRMPPIEPGDVLAVLDAGAYFSVLERNFGFLRSAIVGVAGGEARLLRRRETPEDAVRRDLTLLRSS